MFSDISQKINKSFTLLLELQLAASMADDVLFDEVKMMSNLIREGFTKKMRKSLVIWQTSLHKNKKNHPVMIVIE